MCGFDDGAVCLLNLDSCQGKSFRRPIFKKESPNAEQLSGLPYDQFDESTFEHADSIVSIETTQDFEGKDSETLLLSASKAGELILWQVKVKDT